LKTLEKIDNSGAPAGLAKTRKIIRAEKDREIQFMKICARIKINDCKKDRAEKQRNDRKEKRNLK